MRIEELIDFYKLSNYNSFSSAANDLYTSRYNLMRNITNLENDLGVKLFLRKSKGIYLTDAGKEILNEVSEIVDHYGKMQEIAKEHQGERSVLRIGCYANNSTTYAMLNSINYFNASQREYVAEYVSVEQKNIITMLKEGEIDFAFTIEKASSDDLKAFPIVKREIFALVNNESKLIGRQSISEKELRSFGLVIPQLTGGTERILAKKFGDSILSNIKLKSNDFFYLFSYVSHNDCVGMFNLEDSRAAQKVFDNLTVLPLNPPVYAELALISESKNCNTEIKRSFIEFVQKNYRNF